MLTIPTGPPQEASTDRADIFDDNCGVVPAAGETPHPDG
jgi:hypothetical protein